MPTLDILLCPFWKWCCVRGYTVPHSYLLRTLGCVYRICSNRRRTLFSSCPRIDATCFQTENNCSCGVHSSKCGMCCVCEAHQLFIALVLIWLHTCMRGVKCTFIAVTFPILVVPFVIYACGCCVHQLLYLTREVQTHKTLSLPSVISSSICLWSVCLLHNTSTIIGYVRTILRVCPSVAPEVIWKPEVGLNIPILQCSRTTEVSGLHWRMYCRMYNMWHKGMDSGYYSQFTVNGAVLSQSCSSLELSSLVVIEILALSSR